MNLTESDLEVLALGAEFLGAGGGGSARSIVPLLRRYLTESPLPLRTIESFSAPSWICAVAQIGSPMIGLERMSSDEMSQAIRTLERHLDIRFDGIIPLEIGGQNTVTAALAAAELGIPLVDGDGMGRAFPGIHQTVLTLADITITPICMASPSGDTILITNTAPEQAEPLARRVLPALGGRAALAGYPARAEHLREAIIPGSVSRAMEIGRWLQKGAPSTTPEGVHSATRGVIADLERYDESLSITVLDDERVIRLGARTEFRSLLFDGLLVASSPDIISATDDRGFPLSLDQLETGLTIRLFHASPGKRWYRDRKSLELATWQPDAPHSSLRGNR